MLDPNDEILIGFIEESFEALDEIEPELIEIQEGGVEGDYELINSIFRAFHTMKGSAGFLDLAIIVDLTHKAETLLDIFRSDSSLIEPTHINTILETCDLVRKILNDINSDKFNEQAEMLGFTLELQIESFSDPLDDSLFELQQQVNLNYQEKQNAEESTEEDDEDFVEPIERPEFQELFAKETAETITEIIKLCKQEIVSPIDREEVERHAHTLKGHLAFLQKKNLGLIAKNISEIINTNPRLEDKQVKQNIIEASKNILTAIQNDFPALRKAKDLDDTIEGYVNNEAPIFKELKQVSSSLSEKSEFEDEDFISSVNLLETLLKHAEEANSSTLTKLNQEFELSIQNHVDPEFDKVELIATVRALIQDIITELSNEQRDCQVTQESLEEADNLEKGQATESVKELIDSSVELTNLALDETDDAEHTFSGLDLEDNDNSSSFDDFIDFDDMEDFDIELPKLEINAEMLKQFIGEGHDTLENAEHDILDLLKDNNNQNLLNSAMRNIHTFKGNCGFFSFALLQAISHQAETLLVNAQEGNIPFTDTLGQTLLEVIDILKGSLNTLENEGIERIDNQEIIQEILEDLIQTCPDSTTSSEEDPRSVDVPSTIEEDSGSTDGSPVFVEDEKVTNTDSLDIIDQIDLDKIEENAIPATQEKIDLSETFDQVEKQYLSSSTSEEDKDELPEFTAEEVPPIEQIPVPSANPKPQTQRTDGFYFVEHPKTGTAKKKIVVVEDDESSIKLIAKILSKQGYETHCCLRAQNALDILKENNGQFDLCISDINMPEISGPDFIKKVNTLYHDMPILIVSSEQDKSVLKGLFSLDIKGFVDKPISGTKFKELIIETFKKSGRKKMLEGKSSTSSSSSSNQRRDIRVDLDKLDTLINLVGELIIAESMVTHSEDLEGLELPNFEKASHQLRLITNELQDIAMAIRMVPVEATFKKMKRLIHDLSNKSGKKLKLHLEGADTEVDKSVIDMIADPLVHMLRNSADHDVEDTAGRQAADKEETGNIYLSAEQACDEVLITIRDDGRGLNREKILEKAMNNNLVKDGTELEDEEVYQLIFEPGFSTADAITDISGRGVGMDVVKSNIERVKGRIEIKNKPGKGCSFIIHIPLTLATIEGMLVRVGGTKYTIPINRIRESLKIQSDIITERPDGQEFIKIRESILPVFRLHQLHDIKSDSQKLDEGIIIVIELNDGQVCLFVDEILYQIQTVIKPLSGFMGRIKGISGCNILGNGELALILDVQSLFKKQSINKNKLAKATSGDPS